MAFNTGRGYSNRGRGYYNNRGGSSRGRSGGGGTYSTRERGFHQQFTGGSRPTCQIYDKYGHSAARCHRRFDQDYQIPESLHNAVTAVKLSDQEQLNGQEWYPNFAATAHITNNRSQLQSAEPYLGHDQVIVGNGDYLPITHVSSFALQLSQDTLPLNDVLVCPAITKSLLSV